MILDFDYLPLPAIPGDTVQQDRKSKNRPDGRAATFARLDTDGDGRLSKQEFSVNRKPADADEWFAKRDANHDGSISRDEYIPTEPLR